MSRLGIQELLILLVPSLILGALLLVVPFWRIFSRAGYSGALSLLMMIPGVNLILLYFLAFSDWPSLRAPVPPPPPPGAWGR